MTLAGCDNAAEPEAPRQEASPEAGQVEKWSAKVDGWEILIEVASTELGGTRFQSGTASSNKPGCLAKGTVAGNTNGKGGVTWVATGEKDLELVIEGVQTGATIAGTVETRDGPAECSLGRRPLTWQQVQ